MVGDGRSEPPVPPCLPQLLSPLSSQAWAAGRGRQCWAPWGRRRYCGSPPELRNLTLHFGKAVWKRDTEDPQRKLILLEYCHGNYTNYMQGQNRFHKLDFSLEILNTSRQDGQLYEYIVSKGPEEKVWQIQLEVYEPVSDPSIQILSWALANGSCTVTLNCTAERGDNISYSWDSSTSGLCSHHGSLLNLSYPLQNTSITCACMASNPVSRRVVNFSSSECSYEQGVFTVVFVARLAMPKASQEHSQLPLAEDSAVHTIYSQVQRVEKQKAAPAAEDPSCTTIYAAATGLPPDTAPAPGRAPCTPRSPQTQAPALQGHPPLSQSPDKEPMTVYASVTMPVA